MAFPWSFARALREKYPQASVKLVNAGIGGTSTAGRLANFDAEVLAHRPDLVTIEFVNDCGLPAETLLNNWRQAIQRTKATGADVIVVTPHLVMPPWMGWTYEDMWRLDNREAVELMRQVARETGAGLADVSRRWDHLCQEGPSCVTLLWNGINHPDNRGHELFVRELMTFF
ncbi:MAG: SGNH/GDSL hydrolase family protein [Armatimonadetes bacterium]|nr:SGNH/GDSL hydrolase family protein [Armatimonadota bacterium]